MTEPTVVYEEQGAVALVTLNRPAQLNSLNLEMHQALWQALDQAEANATVRALVLTGAGRGFCAGADLSAFDFSEGPNRVERADPGPVIERSFNPTTRRLMNLRMPIVAAINGHFDRLTMTGYDLPEFHIKKRIDFERGSIGLLCRTPKCTAVANLPKKIVGTSVETRSLHSGMRLHLQRLRKYVWVIFWAPFEIIE